MFVSTEHIAAKMMSTLQQDSECFNETLHLRTKISELLTEYCDFLSDAASKLHTQAEFLMQEPASPNRNVHIEKIINRAIAICHRIEEGTASEKEQNTLRLARLYELASSVMAEDESRYYGILVAQSKAQSQVGNNSDAVTLLDQALCLMGYQKSNARLTGSDDTHQRVADVLHKKGLILTHMGDYQQALYCLAKGFALAEACTKHSQLHRLQADILKAMGVVVVMRDKRKAKSIESMTLSTYLFEEALSRQVCALRGADRGNYALQIVDSSLLDHLRHDCLHVESMSGERSDHIDLKPCRIFKVLSSGPELTTSAKLCLSDVIHAMLVEVASSRQIQCSSLTGEWGVRALVALLAHDKHLLVESERVIDALFQVMKAHSTNRVVVGEVCKGLLSVLKVGQAVKIGPLADRLITALAEVLDAHKRDLQVLKPVLMVMHELVGASPEARQARETWETKSVSNEGGEHMDSARVTVASDSAAQWSPQNVCPVQFMLLLLNKLKVCVEGEPNATLHILEMMEVFLSDSVAGGMMQKGLHYGAQHGVRVCLPSLIQTAVSAFPENTGIQKAGRKVYDMCRLPMQHSQSKDDKQMRAKVRITKAVQRLNEKKGVVQHQTDVRLHAAIQSGLISSGVRWVKTAKRNTGTEISSEALAEALQRRLRDVEESLFSGSSISSVGDRDIAPANCHVELTTEEQEIFSVKRLPQDCYVKIDGTTYLKPADSLESLLNEHVHVNSIDQKSQTALFVASSKGMKDAVVMLLKAGASVHLVNDTKQTPLYKAAENGHTEIVKMLISAKANVNISDKDGDTAVSAAAYCGHADTVQELIRAGANVDAYPHHTSPISWAATFGHVPVIELLIQAGANVNAPDKLGRTPLDLAMLHTAIHPAANKRASFLLRNAGAYAGALGLKWSKLGSSRPEGSEIRNAALAKALYDSAMSGAHDEVAFTRDEWDQFHLTNLSVDSYIEVKSSSADPVYFKPAQVSTLNRQDASLFFSSSQRKRSSTRASGLRWEIITKPSQGHKITNSMLARALERQTEFKPEEWDAFGIEDLRVDDFIHSGTSFFRPVVDPNCHACAQPIKVAPANWSKRHEREAGSSRIIL